VPGALWIIAGVNGAGKTTRTRNPEWRQRINATKWLNPDEIAADVMQRISFYRPKWVEYLVNLLAAEYVEAALKRHIRQGMLEGIVIETVLSSRKYEKYMKEVKTLGGEVGMFYVGVDTVQMSIDRVEMRVKEGGHDVPLQKLRDRWPRSLDNLVTWAREVDYLYVFVNNDENDPDPLVIEKTDGRFVTHRTDVLPDLLSRFRNAGLIP